MAVSSISFSPCLFFETAAEEAARFYVSIFPNSSIDSVSHFMDTGHEVHQRALGSVMAVSFHLNGSKWIALNSRPKEFVMDESISFQIHCEGQEDVDYFWNKLSEGGDPARQVCGWVKDRFGVHWQVVPKIVAQNMESGDEKKMLKTMKAFMNMKKIIVQDIADAVEG